MCEDWTNVILNSAVNMDQTRGRQPFFKREPFIKILITEAQAFLKQSRDL